MPRNQLIQIRKGTTAQWDAADTAATGDPARLLAAGELGQDTTTKVLKIGDGATKFADLDGYLNEADVAAKMNASVAPGGPARSVLDSAYVLKGSDPKVTPYLARLAHRYTASVNILVGPADSFTEGTGATVLMRRWLNIVQDALRDRYQPAGVEGAALPYIAAFPGAGGTITNWPVTRTGNISQKNWTGLGLHAAEFSADGTGVATFTFPGTSAKLAYSSGTFGKVRIVTNGGTAQVVDTYSPTLAGGNLIPITGLTSGTNTVVVTRDASSVVGRTIVVEGLHVWNGDETSGIRLVEAAHHGTAASQYADAFTSNFAWGSIAAVGPLAAVVVALGLNDATSAGSVPTIKADLQNVVTKLRAAPVSHAGTIFLLYWPLRTGTNAAKWAAIGVAMQEIEAGDPFVKFVNVRGKIPDEGTSFSDPANLGLYQNTDHFNDAGNVFAADVILSALTV